MISREHPINCLANLVVLHYHIKTGSANYFLDGNYWCLEELEVHADSETIVQMNRDLMLKLETLGYEVDTIQFTQSPEGVATIG